MPGEFPAPPVERAIPADRLVELLSQYPHIADRIFRQLLIALHERGIVTIDEVYDQARAAPGEATHLGAGANPNVAEAPRGDSAERERVHDITRRYVCEHLTASEIEDIVNLTRKREEAEKLRAIVALGSLTFRLLSDTVRRFCALPEGERQLAPDEAMGIRVGLIRHLISDQLEFIAVAKHVLRIRDFEEIVNRTVGAEAGMGRVGGKAAGMLLAAKIINGPRPAPAVHTDSRVPVVEQASSATARDLQAAIPESYFLRSDVIEDFIAFNHLGEYQSQKYKTPDEIRKEYRLIRSVFRNGEFPAAIVDRLRAILERIGLHPVIVRSSSLLEDRFGTAFSGKYASIFVANQGGLEKRLRALLGAITEVYASALGPDPLLYRREHDLIDYEEDMAVLIQKVVGRPFGPYFSSLFAGVALSRNDYRWSPRIRREDGVMRIVMGLGTRAVDRIGAEFPRMVALGMPTLRHESSPAEIVRHAQRTLDVINLQKNKLESIKLEQVLPHAAELLMLDQLISIYQDGVLTPPTGTYIDADPKSLIVTFDKMMSGSDFAPRLSEMLKRVEKAYGRAVDIEFAHDGRQLYLLQCRTLAFAPELDDISIPTDVPDERMIFTANRFVRSGLVENIEFIIYIDPRDYERVPSRERRHTVARVLGRLNERLAGRNFILVGPGRWGSSDIRLGVPVTYADINKAKMLVEVAREHEGYVPEVSYGTHFFLDLMEANIAYLPLYPDDRRNRFNETFLRDSPNSLPQLLPKDASLCDVVQVIDIPKTTGGRRLRVVMDGKVDRAAAYLADPVS